MQTAAAPTCTGLLPKPARTKLHIGDPLRPPAQGLHREGGCKAPDYRKELHLGKGCNVGQRPLFKSALAGVSLTGVSI